MNRPVFALIDCNNFFVSCERLFRPDLEGKPVVVLSSNDGCAVARSNEAKALGITMAAPAFKYRDLFKREGVVQFSANFELYGDVSRRIVDLLTSVTPKIEVYSVDESFLDLSELNIADYDEWGRTVRDLVYKWVGVPVSIGIAPSKTLAKLASERAKKDPSLDGVLSLCHPEFISGSMRHNSTIAHSKAWMLKQVQHDKKIEFHLSQAPIGDVWGVGWRYAPKLRAEQVWTALDLKNMRPQFAQKLMGIHGRQMVAELNGTCCYPLKREGKPRQSIARTRTFGQDTTDLGSIQAALATFVGRAAYRLRESNQLTQRIGVFAQTNKHKPGFASYKREAFFDIPTADTGRLMSKTMELFNDMYSGSTLYHRAGVYLWDFLPANQVQVDLFGEVQPEHEAASWARMQALDSLNNRYGRKTVHYAAEDLGKKWRPIYKLRSPRYTSRWSELPTVRPL